MIKKLEGVLDDKVGVKTNGDIRARRLTKAKAAEAMNDARTTPNLPPRVSRATKLIKRIRANSTVQSPSGGENSEDEMEQLRAMRTAMCQGCGRYYESKMWVKLHLRHGTCSGKRLGIKEEPKDEINQEENTANNNEEDERVE